MSTTPGAASIPAIQPRPGPIAGHQFAFYGDCCSGIAGRPVEATFAAINRVLARLEPAPEFLWHLGDHIAGERTDADWLRQQWKYWIEHEMAWLDQHRTPLLHVAGNHDTFCPLAEDVWRETFASLPRHGPPGQDGLSYWTRRGDLLLVGVDTVFSGLGGGGHVECAWLDEVLRAHADARYKFVGGHYPVHAVNGYAEHPSWRIVPDEGRAFWAVMVRHGVRAYLCSHIIAFDAQVHQGVLQLCSGGAGTKSGPGGFMPGAAEYHHAVQAAVDATGLRFQVLDLAGQVREQLAWPPRVPPARTWMAQAAGDDGSAKSTELRGLILWRFQGRTADRPLAADQTLLCGSASAWDWNNTEGPERIWIGIEAHSAAVAVQLVCRPGDGVRTWRAPALAAGAPFDFQLAIHPGLGPGGVLGRRSDDSPWSSLQSSSALGADAEHWPARWALGHGLSGPTDRPFGGTGLVVTTQTVDQDERRRGGRETA